jgi:hypothetical protein
MPFAARNLDEITTGHACDLTSSIIAAKAVKIFINNKMAAVTGDIIAPHTILAGDVCVPHSAVTGAGSLKVFLGGFSANRVGDPADLGFITTGSANVSIG